VRRHVEISLQADHELDSRRAGDLRTRATVLRRGGEVGPATARSLQTEAETAVHEQLVALVRGAAGGALNQDGLQFMLGQIQRRASQSGWLTCRVLWLGSGTPSGSR
jgi:hypothetical protein